MRHICKISEEQSDMTKRPMCAATPSRACRPTAGAAPTGDGTSAPYTENMSQASPGRHLLHTERLHLEILHENHADEMFDVLQDPAIYRYMDGRPSTTEELRQQYKRQSSNWDGRPASWHTWVIREKQTNTAIGYIQATVNHSERNAELAWVLSPLWTGKRYSSEAARRVMKELHDEGLVSAFTCTIDQRNAPSRRLAESLGFVMSDPEPVDSQTWTLHVDPNAVGVAPWRNRQ